ncbi:MAG: alpha-1,4-glucan--maltose-1-phosphate maltosyltransferase [Cyclobacteriaceae bacterium]|nr:alpha-1,4-glucan--maltose-1-phosphate maltosyltransferase [Cyclobacteriaceae bacterium]
MSKDGQSRVVIENVQPAVDGGRYPAKRTVGERVDVTANLFGDGHDHIRARVSFRKASSAEWSQAWMTDRGNDEWAASFYAEEEGSYLFFVEAWIDHFETWYDGFRKKALAGVDVKLELLEGAIFLDGASATEASLSAMATRFRDPARYKESIGVVLSAEFAAIVERHPAVQFVTTSGDPLRVLVEGRRALYSTWYELFPRSSALEGGRHGTFLDTVKLLPRIATMGFDVLYLPPIHPIGKVNRKGKNNSVTAKAGEPGSPWAIGSDEGGHKALHPELGTLADFHKLVTEARKLQIAIAMDIAFQCAPDHPYVKDHPDWFRQRPDGSIQYAENPPKKYQDIYPFNFESADWKGLWEELRSVFLYWVEQGVTIFRVDNPHTKPIRFWEWVIGEIRSKHPEVIFLSEAFTRPKVMASLAKVGFTQSYTYFTWRNTKQEIMEYMNELVHGPSRNYFRPNFWPNTPDILPYHLQHQGENIFIIRAALAATMSASYGIYGPPFEFFENQPVEGKEEYVNSEKYEIKHYDWKRTNRMTDLLTMINRARREHPALQSTWNLQFCPIENPHLLAFIKTTDDLSDVILVVVNLDPHTPQSGYVQVPRSRLKLSDKINLKLTDLMTQEHYTWTQEWNYVELNPYKLPFHVFHVRIHESQM